MLATMAVAPAASAANLTDCVKMAKEVAAAIQSAQPGDTTEQARSAQNAGRMYCSSSMYTQGVAAYSKALQLLGKA
jgi:hypothetical protein